MLTFEQICLLFIIGMGLWLFIKLVIFSYSDQTGWFMRLFGTPELISGAEEE